MRQIQQSQYQFFEENGYVVLPGLIPQKLTTAAAEAIWTFLNARPNDPESWYSPFVERAGQVSFYHHQALWNIRQHPALYEAFWDLLGTPRLWVNMDRVMMKPPAKPGNPAFDQHPYLHFDIDVTKQPLPRIIQGIVALSDTEANQGCFHCAPGMHQEKARLLIPRLAESNPYRIPHWEDLSITAVPCKAGDVIVFDASLPHGGTVNTSDKPRLAQFVSMIPSTFEKVATRDARIRLWKNRLPPPNLPPDPTEREIKNGVTAELSPLGRCLLGLEDYPPADESFRQKLGRWFTLSGSLFKGS